MRRLHRAPPREEGKTRHHEGMNLKEKGRRPITATPEGKRPSQPPKAPPTLEQTNCFGNQRDGHGKYPDSDAVGI